MLEKLLCSICLLIFTQWSLFAQDDSIVIAGILHGKSPAEPMQMNMTILDQKGQNDFKLTSLKDGKFRFVVPKYKLPAEAKIIIVHNNFSNNVPLEIFIHDSNLQISGEMESLSAARVQGDPENETFNAIRQRLSKEAAALELLKESAMSNLVSLESEEGQQLSEKLSAFNYEIGETYVNYIAKNPSLYSSLYLLKKSLAYYSADSYKSAFESLNSLYKNSIHGLAIQSKIGENKSTARGRDAFDFVRITSSGDELRLSALKGKVVLLDFWGSACIPCKEGMPHLRDLYNKYKSKGFEIIGVGDEREGSMAKNDIKWKSTIEAWDLPWLHVFDRNASDGDDISKKYTIYSNPTMILIDANGKILQRVMSKYCDAVDVELKKIFGY